MASILRVNTLTDASSGNSTAMSTINQGTAKAWFNFNGTGTVAILDSFNAASITDNGTGDYTTTISNAMATINYCYTALGGNTSASSTVRIENTDKRTTTKMELIAYNTSQAELDMADLNALFHGDLA
jgi:WD40 repeat protein